MTNEDKFKAIIERIKAEGWCNDPAFISIMMIVNYLDKLSKHGIVECAYNMTESGQRVAAICEEFDWKPTDDDILRFVTEMVEDSEKVAFAYMIKRYRDDKEKFIEEIQNDLGK
jgi:hypothetical protein